MTRFASALAIFVLSACLNADGVSDYLKLRSSHHIVQPVDPANLDRFTGTKLVEIRGTITGAIKSGGAISLMLRRSDDEPMLIDCGSNPPDWVLNGEVAVRVLAQIGRVEPKAPLTANVVAIAPEADIRKVDDQYWAAEAAKHPVTRRASRTEPLASRGSGSLRGWIGGPHFRSGNVVSEKDAEYIYADFIHSCNPRLPKTEALRISSSIIRASLAYELDPRIAVSVFIVESGFDPTSTNPKSGAMGVGQLMPGTAAWMGVHNAYDSVDNVIGAIRLLKTLNLEYLAAFNDPDPRVRNRHALTLTLAAAYNAGEGAVKKYGGIPPYAETEHYVARVEAIYDRLCSNDRVG